jgi:hypothetical protein
MKRAQRTAAQTRSSFQKSFGGLGNIVKAGLAGVVSGLSIGLIAQGVKSALEYAGSLGEVAQQLGVTTKELQIFRYAVQQNGGTLEQADKALGKFATSISQARSGSAQMAKTFDAVGVSLADLETKSKSDILGQIADEMKRTGGASANAAAGVKIFGKDFKSIVPTLDLGSKGFNEVAAAAEKLGIIMDDALIQQADDASDKLDSLATILKAQVSVAVAESSGEIVELGNSFAGLIGFIGDAIGYLQAFRGALNALSAKRIELSPFSSKEEKANARVALFRARLDQQQGLGKFKPGSFTTSKPKAGGGSPSQFLAGGGGKTKRDKADDAERKRQEALRAAYQFDQELLRAQMDVVRAQQQLATDYSERAALSIQILNLEKQGFQREMEYAVASGDLTKAQAAQLEAENAKRDELDRQAVLLEEETRRREDYNMLDAKSADIQLDILERQADLADTWQERRAIEHKILDLAYEEERRRLTRITEESQDWAEIEAARRDLLALTQKQALDRQGVNQNTMGPMESAQVQFGDLSEEMENLRVNGIMAAGDALATLATEGFGSFKEQAIGAIKAVIAEFIRLQTIKFLFNAIGGAMGGGMSAGMGGGAGGLAGLYGGVDPMFLTGMATGGSGIFGGIAGVDKNVLSLNGMPIARVSKGERFAVSPDAERGGGGMSIHAPITIMGNASRETAMQIGAKMRTTVASANRKGA